MWIRSEIIESRSIGELLNGRFETSLCPADISNESKIIRKARPKGRREWPQGNKKFNGCSIFSFLRVEEPGGERKVKRCGARGEKMKGGSNENFRVFRVDRGILPRSWQLLSNKVNAYFSFPFPCSIPPRDARQITRDQLWETLTVTRLHTEKGKGGREKMWNCRDRSCRFVEENRQRYGAWEEFFFSFLFWEWTLVKLEGKFFNSNMHELAFVRLLCEYLGIFYIMERWLRCLMDTIYYSKDHFHITWIKIVN